MQQINQLVRRAAATAISSAVLGHAFASVVVGQLFRPAAAVASDREGQGSRRGSAGAAESGDGLAAYDVSLLLISLC